MSAPSGMLIARLYGSNENLRNDKGRTRHIVAKTEVEALPDVVYFDMDVTGLFAGLELENETLKFITGNELVINNPKIVFEPKLMSKSYPKTGVPVSINDFYGLDVLKKRYKWLDIAGYSIRPDIEGEQVFAVNVLDFLITSKDGSKEISFKLKER